MQVEGYLGLRLIGAVKDWLECQFWEGIWGLQKKKVSVLTFDGNTLDYLLREIFLPKNLFVWSCLNEIPLFFILNVTLDGLIFTNLTFNTQSRHKLHYCSLLFLPLHGYYVGSWNTRCYFPFVYVLSSLRVSRNAHHLLLNCDYQIAAAVHLLVILQHLLELPYLTHPLWLDTTIVLNEHFGGRKVDVIAEIRRVIVSFIVISYPFKLRLRSIACIR